MKFNEDQKKILKKLILSQFDKLFEAYGKRFSQSDVLESLESMSFRHHYYKEKDTKNWICLTIDQADIIHFFGRPSKIDSALNRGTGDTGYWDNVWIQIPKDIAFKALTLGFFTIPEEWLSKVKKRTELDEKIDEVNHVTLKKLYEEFTQVREELEEIKKEAWRPLKPKMLST